MAIIGCICLAIYTGCGQAEPEERAESHHCQEDGDKMYGIRSTYYYWLGNGIFLDCSLAEMVRC